MNLTYCPACLVAREDKHFTNWEQDKTKGRRCDQCYEKKLDKDELIRRRREINAMGKVELSPELKKVARDLDAKHKLQVRNRLEEIEYQRQMKDIDELFT